MFCPGHSLASRNLALKEATSRRPSGSRPRPARCSPSASATRPSSPPAGLAAAWGAGVPRGQRDGSSSDDPAVRRLAPAHWSGLRARPPSPGPVVAGVPVRLPAGLRYAILVTPDLKVGDTGWCSITEFTLPAARTRLIGGGSACAPAIAHAVTTVAGGGALTNVSRASRACISLERHDNRSGSAASPPFRSAG